MSLRDLLPTDEPKRNPSALERLFAVLDDGERDELVELFQDQTVTTRQLLFVCNLLAERHDVDVTFNMRRMSDYRRDRRYES